jgi:hypothetical protein
MKLSGFIIISGKRKAATQTAGEEYFFCRKNVPVVLITLIRADCSSDRRENGDSSDTSFAKISFTERCLMQLMKTRCYWLTFTLIDEAVAKD